jgi:hypothetical protein
MSTLNVNIPESIRRRAEALARDDGISLDQFIATALAEKVAVLDADSYIRARAARGSREKFERVLAKVPTWNPSKLTDSPRRMPGEHATRQEVTPITAP